MKTIVYLKDMFQALYLKIVLLSFALILSLNLASAQSDSQSNALIILEGNTNCGAGYTNQGSTADSAPSCSGLGFSSLSNSVWFKFTARSPQVNIGVTGLSMSNVKTLLLKDGTNTVICGNGGGINNPVVINSSSLIVGQLYYLAVYSANVLSSKGSFRLCFDNCGSAPALSISEYGSNCYGQSTAHVKTVSSEIGVSYFLNGVIQIGTGQSIQWNNVATGTHTITANRGYGCPVVTAATVNIQGYSDLISYSVGGGGTVCSNGSGVNVTLSLSEPNIVYVLRLNGTELNSPLFGTSGPLVWPNITQPGNYTVIAKRFTGCEKVMSGNVSVTAASVPFAYQVSGGGAYCTGTTGVNVLLSGSETNVFYQLMINGISDGPVVFGTGQPITWSGQQTTGSYTVRAINTISGCPQMMSSQATVNSNPAPNVYNVQGGGDFCNSTTSPAITLSGSQLGVKYGVLLQGEVVGTVINGTGGSLSWENLPAGNNYSIVARADNTACLQTMNGTVSINERPQPNLFTISGGGTRCEGTSGLDIYLSGSEESPSYPTYQLMRNGVSYGPGLPGVESPLIWPAIVDEGTYTVVAVSSLNCSRLMEGSVQIIVSPAPSVFTLSGGGEVCSGNQATLSLSGSEQNVSYQMMIDGIASGSPLAGNGNTLTWSGSIEGSYTINATHSQSGCVSFMSGTANVHVIETPQVFDVSSGELNICLNSDLVISLQSSEIGVTYQLQKDGASLLSAKSGTGASLSWTVNAQQGAYTIIASRQICTMMMNGSIVPSILPLPQLFTFTGGGAVYDKSPSIKLTLHGSQSGIEYTLLKNGVAVSPPLAGNGKKLFWTDQRTLGAYRVKAVNTSTGCEQLMRGQGFITNQILPEEVKITRSGVLPVPPVERKYRLDSIQLDAIIDVFKAPPCLEGKYYAGFQLYYDLGNRETVQQWTSQLSLTLLHGEDSVLTLPLLVNTTDQTFVSTAFFDSLVSCTDDYRIAIREKKNVGNVPEANIYLKILLYRKDALPFSPATTLSLNCSPIGNKTSLSWTCPDNAASEFDIEWVFISQEEKEKFTGTSALDAFQFKEPVRVTVTGANYKHINYYPTGTLWYRARAVGYNPLYPTHRIQGEWSYSPCDSISVTNPELDMNWQEQTVFAEDGKYKKIVNYFDGTMRQRQVQTNLSTEDISLIGESLYDFEGRPSVQVLPVPGEDNTLTYKANFNSFVSTDQLILNNTTDGKTKFHYDNRRVANSKLSAQNGAEKYYSSNNTHTDITHRDYIPQSQGYPYTQTEYTNDGTGRVSRQSGVGPVFRQDGDHTTRTYYGTVAQAELVRLFGSNVGNASHYHKTMVVDANNQVSVTYVDQEGRTIATALAGNSPSNVDSLESLRLLNPTPITVDITGRNVKDKGAWSINHTILNEAPNTLYTFRYDMAALASEVETFGCKECVFDLEMQLTDPEGMPISFASVAGNESPDTLRYLRKGITAICGPDSTKVNDINFAVYLKDIGDYTLTKTLSAHELTFDQMQAIVGQELGVQSQIAQIQNSYAADPSQCAICTELCPEAEQAIEEAMQEVAEQDCENVLHQIIAELKAPYEQSNPDYEPTQGEIEAHAAHCHYVLCKKNIPSDVFDMELTRYASWSAAITAGNSNPILQDPFFNNAALSGVTEKDKMQGRLDDVFVGNVGYDSDNDGEMDGTDSYYGTIDEVTDPANTNFYIDNNGNRDVNGFHLLYATIMAQRSVLGETEYQKQIDEQRWTLYRNFYVEAKRKIKLDIPAYKACPAILAQLGVQDELPKTPEDMETWAAQQPPTYVNEVSQAELYIALHNISSSCNSVFSETDSTDISTHLKNYFNSNKKNFFRMIIRTDLTPLGGATPNNHLVAIQGILDKYSCSLDSIAVENPFVCAQDTTVTIPAQLISQLDPRQSSRAMGANRKILVQSVDSERLKNESLTTGTDSIRHNSRHERKRREFLLRLQRENDSIRNLVREEWAKSGVIDESNKSVARVASRAVALLANSAVPSQSEYDALVDFYNSTLGNNWNNTRQGNKVWDVTNLVSHDISGWYGITLDANGNVTELILNSNSLYGTILPSIGNLTHLTKLSVSNNYWLSGSIPSQIQYLTQLNYLDLSGNRFNSIPSTLGDLSSLNFLNLYSNQLTIIPTTIGNLSSLETLNVSFNLITNIPTEIGSLSSLKDLNISRNEITSIPASIGNLSNLEILNLFGTKLIDFPTAISSLSSLKNLNLEANQITSIPTSIGNLINLETLILYGNKITDIPVEIGDLDNLKNLDLENNLITSIPASIGNLSNLETLNLYRNNISDIPEEIGSLASLKDLNLANNKLTGFIPATIGNLGSLVNLYLYHNQLKGAIPPTIGNLDNLIKLYLYENQLTDSIPATIGGLSSLGTLYLYDNQLKGAIPFTIGNLSNLGSLDLSENQLTSIPASIGSLSGLTRLDLSDNKIKNFPAEISGLINLYNLDLGNNQIDAVIPADLGNLDKLDYLDLSQNELYGDVPASFSSFTGMYHLYLNDNHLTGRLAPECLDAPGGTYLDISNNKFTFTDILEAINNYGSDTDYPLYAPQDSIDVQNKIIVLTPAQPITFTTNIDRNTISPSKYQWFKYVDGVNDIPLNSQSTTGHTFTISSPSTADIGRYYYTIDNDGIHYQQLILISHIQTVTAGPQSYSICLGYDDNNPTLQKFNYTVDWNKEIQQCMQREAVADSILSQMAVQKLMEQQVSNYYKKFSTQCLQRVTEKMAYTYVSKEYHYTLYYYDQGANLVQTVPPSGVHPLTPIQVNDFLRGIKTEPPHNLLTNYSYTSLNQLIAQRSPDAGDSKFWYNDKGQLRLSQNAQQNLDVKYSYTKYDKQGRINEVGELGTVQSLTTLLDSLNSLEFPLAGQSDYQLADITKTHYDFADSNNIGLLKQEHLRSRVAWVEIVDRDATDTIKTHYTYDVHGNVKALLQTIPGLESKRTDYVYDLVSGKVNYVLYQYGRPDQFMHQYNYDGDNRIIQVQTSSDGFLWNKEADYAYNLHGPLARTELGHYRVQGQDYYYTLQGWIKGANMPFAGDPGADGLQGNKTGKDVFAYTLGYFDGDYNPIGNGVVSSDNRDQLWQRSLENIRHTGLYNGNISWMTTDLPAIGHAKADPLKSMQSMLYRYDQLHRITVSRSLSSYTQANGFAERTSIESYDEDYSYDANGNIRTLKRNDELATLKDDFSYDYYANSNKLKNVKTTQIQNYIYDAIGNLVSDVEQGVSINWTPYGKVRSVQKGDSIRTTYRYDASGNRVEKRAVIGDSTVVTNYLRDAGGNVMSIYSDTVATEIPIYGSSRLGQYKGGVMEGHRTLGHRTYELSNHLGNVLAVITDNAGMKQDSVWSKVTNTSDYYPFGLEMKGRSLNVATEEVTEGECLECADLKTQLDAYVTANGAPALSNRTALTDFLNNELNRSTTQAEYESSFKQCELVNTYTSFTGGNYVDFGKQPQYELGTSDFTIEAWIRMPLNFGYDCLPIVTNQNNYNGYNGIHFTICSRRLGFSVSEGAPSADAVVFMNASFPDDNQWHHVVIERRGNRIADFRIYLDSVNVSSLELQTDNLVTGNMNTGGLEAMRIGTRKYTNSNQEYNFTGDIKQVRIYNRALSSVEVEQSYAQGLFGTTANQNGLILWAPLDEGAGQQSKDESAYAETGTHTGTGAAWKSELNTYACTTCTTNVLCTTTSSSPASAYRYGFNGKEKDNFNTTVYDYGFRIYNPEIAKFLSVDPLTHTYPWYTPYQFAGNKPIWAIDLDGLEEKYVTGWRKFQKVEVKATLGIQADVDIAGFMAIGLNAFNFELRKIEHSRLAGEDWQRTAYWVTDKFTYHSGLELKALGTGFEAQKNWTTQYEAGATLISSNVWSKSGLDEGVEFSHGTGYKLGAAFIIGGEIGYLEGYIYDNWDARYSKFIYRTLLDLYTQTSVADEPNNNCFPIQVQIGAYRKESSAQKQIDKYGGRMLKEDGLYKVIKEASSEEEAEEIKNNVTNDKAFKRKT